MKSAVPKIYRFKEIDSTNSAAFRYAAQGVPSGSVFVAEYQTHGRGRWGSKWLSPPGKNLLFSLLLRPKMKAHRAPGVTQLACRSVAKVIQRRLGVRPSFKRPNDILVGGKKVCGLLVEAKGRANGNLECLVIGIGLNVNASPEEFAEEATSLLAVTGAKQPRQALFKGLLRQLRKDLKGWWE